MLLDYNKAVDGEAAMTRLTPEVCFPETEGWPRSYFANPYPLSEQHYLAAWSDQEMIGWGGGYIVVLLSPHIRMAFRRLLF